MNLWWLSFVDPDRPKGDRFLGVCIVEGINMVDAVLNAHFRGCNPGGEVKGFEILDRMVKHIALDKIGVLLVPGEAQKFSKELDKLHLN